MNGIAFTVPGPPVAKQRKDAWSELELAMLCEHYPRIGQIAVWIAARLALPKEAPHPVSEQARNQ